MKEFIGIVAKFHSVCNVSSGSRDKTPPSRKIQFRVAESVKSVKACNILFAYDFKH